MKGKSLAAKGCRWIKEHQKLIPNSTDTWMFSTFTPQQRKSTLIISHGLHYTKLIFNISQQTR